MYLLNFQSRAVDRTKVANIKEANFYFFWECLMGLSVSLTINILIVSVFAHGLYQKTNADVVSKKNGFHVLGTQYFALYILKIQEEEKFPL